MKKIAIARKDWKTGGFKKGDEFLVISEDFFNGEGQLYLEDSTGRRSTQPDIFFDIERRK